MLVAPKVWDTVDLYEVQLPTGEWYDYWSGTKLQGGHHDSGPSIDPAIERLKIKVDPKTDELPVYVRAGSIIPHQPVVQSTAFTPQGPLELRVYPGPNCSGALYMDDGHTFDYKKDSQLRISMTCTADSSSASLNIDQSRGQYKPWFSELRIVFYGAPSAPKSVLSGKNALKGVYDGEQHTVSVTVPYTGAAEKIQLDF
jgi:alpha-glucosidase